MKKLISIVVPCFNEQESIPYFYKEVDKISKNIESTVHYWKRFKEKEITAKEIIEFLN